MAEPVAKTSRAQSMGTAGVITGTLATLNTAFFFASQQWGQSNQEADLTSIRGAFGVLTLVLSVLAYVSAIAPRVLGHSLAVLLGLGSIANGIASEIHGLPQVMSITLLIAGALMLVLAKFSWQRSRAAWAFLVALLAVFGTVVFFGAPKVRGFFGIGLWTALLVPGVQFVAVTALAMVRGEYREPT